MRDSAAYVVPWLYILNLGIAFGAGLHESRIAVPQWLSHTPEAGYRLTRGDVHPESAAVAKARQWVRLGYLRHAATLIAWLAALQAFSSPAWK